MSSVEIVTQSCSKCGKRVEPQECWPIAFPESGSFWRLVCDCGWFGPPADTKEQCVSRGVINDNKRRNYEFS